MTALLDCPASEMFGPDIPVMTGDCRLRQVKVSIEHDQDTESPLTHDSFQLVTRSYRGGGKKTDNNKKFEELFPDGKPTIGMRRKLATGTAWLVDYYEHGNCDYSLAGHGPQCQWDTSRNAGVLMWMGKASDIGADAEKRTKAAASLLEEYTLWANGECYYYSIKDADTDEILESCGGFIGYEYVEEEAKSMGESHGEIVETNSVLG